MPNSGRLTIRVTLRQADRVAAEGTVEWELAERYEWGASIFRQVEDPSRYCFGCRGTVAIPIATWAQRVPGEALWVTWGGQPRDSDIAY